jgi:hypothetical protein
MDLFGPGIDVKLKKKEKKKEGSACIHDGPWFFLSGGSCFLFFFLDQSLPPTISLGQKC